MKLTAVLIGALLGAMILLSGCASRESDSRLAETDMPQDNNGNFTLGICNGSDARETGHVDIRVYIDGKTAVNERFSRGYALWQFWSHVQSVGWWKTFRFSLSDGTHMLKVESVTGEAQLEQEFEVVGDVWADIIYWYRPRPGRRSRPIPKRFTVRFSDEPIPVL